MAPRWAGALGKRLGACPPLESPYQPLWSPWGARPPKHPVSLSSPGSSSQVTSGSESLQARTELHGSAPRTPLLDPRV